MGHFSREKTWFVMGGCLRGMDIPGNETTSFAITTITETTSSTTETVTNMMQNEIEQSDIFLGRRPWLVMGGMGKFWEMEHMKCIESHK